MPSAYRIDSQQRIVWTESGGRVTDSDLLTLYQRMRADAAFDPAYDELCDFTAAAGVGLTPHTVRRLAVETPFDHAARHAIVAPHAAVYGLARMYQAYVESTGNMQVRVFTEMVPACEWLGVNPTTDG